MSLATGKKLAPGSIASAVAALRFLYRVTLRKAWDVEDAISLRPADIDSERMVIRVEQGKGAKDRYVMLSPRLLAILREYWRSARPAGDWLFPGRSPGRHITRDTVEQACERALRLSGIPKHLTPHSLE